MQFLFTKLNKAINCASEIFVSCMRVADYFTFKSLLSTWFYPMKTNMFRLHKREWRWNAFILYQNFICKIAININWRSMLLYDHWPDHWNFTARKCHFIFILIYHKCKAIYVFLFCRLQWKKPGFAWRMLTYVFHFTFITRFWCDEGYIFGKWNMCVVFFHPLGLHKNIFSIIYIPLQGLPHFIIMLCATIQFRLFNSILAYSTTATYILWYEIFCISLQHNPHSFSSLTKLIYLLPSMKKEAGAVRTCF